MQRSFSKQKRDKTSTSQTFDTNGSSMNGTCNTHVWYTAQKKH